MSRKENAFANLKLTNELLRTEVSSLNEQILSQDASITSYRKNILEQDTHIQELKKNLAIAESKIPVEQPTLYTSLSNYLWSFKNRICFN